MNKIQKIILQNQMELLKNWINAFCEERGIRKNFKSFLTYKKHGSILPENINLIMGKKIPSVILYNSKSFYEITENLDQDFFSEIFDSLMSKQVRVETKTDFNLEKMVRDFLKKDFLEFENNR